MVPNGALESVSAVPSLNSNPEGSALGSCPSGGAKTEKGSLLFNTLQRLQELFTRAQRRTTSIADSRIFHKTAKRAWSSLHRLRSPFVWNTPHAPELLDIFHNISWIRAEADEWEKQKKDSRINSWKQKLRESAQGNCKFIFQHLKNKVRDEPPNLVVDASGNTELPLMLRCNSSPKHGIRFLVQTCSMRIQLTCFVLFGHTWIITCLPSPCHPSRGKNCL